MTTLTHLFSATLALDVLLMAYAVRHLRNAKFVAFMAAAILTMNCICLVRLYTYP